MDKSRKLLIIGFILFFLVLFIFTNKNLYQKVYSFFLHAGRQAVSNSIKPTPKKSNDFFKSLRKQNEILNQYVESTPFVWEGELKYLVSERDMKSENTKLAIYDFNTNEKVVTFGEEFGFASALVYDKTLYVFATKNWGKKGESQIYLIKSGDLSNFSDPVLMYKSEKKQAVFNTSVTRNTDNGKFIMVMEVDEDSFVTFTIRLLESSDLAHWKQVPNAIFGKDKYVACPAIRYINSEYYMWFLMEEYNDPNCTKCLTYVIKIAKSKDLVNWKTSPHYFLVPDREDEGINTSDPDLVEYNNKVYFFYAAGDQATWSELRYAMYNSSLSDFVSNFF